MTAAFATTDRSYYGAQEVNGLIDAQAAHDAVDRSETVALHDPRLVRIVRLRLLTDPGFPFFDLSYCYGRLNDGRVVTVDLPHYQFAKRGLNRDLYAMCVKAGVNGKQLGIYDAVSYVN